jgi:DNA-directed RNA polymerase subunit RPC12/RpoP
VEEIIMKLLERLKNSWLLILIIILGFCLLIFSFYDIILNIGLIFVALPTYIALILILLYLIYLRSKIKDIPIEMNVVKEFEKTLEGGLYHYKCPTCKGFFAVKKSKGDNKQYIKMTCPDCGATGVIPPNPASIEEIIPEKKSIKANFKCEKCNEGIAVWAEGTDLYNKLHVYTCPFCGKFETMKRI